MADKKARIEVNTIRINDVLRREQGSRNHDKLVRL
jgi:hypothetical protein